MNPAANPPSTSQLTGPAEAAQATGSEFPLLPIHRQLFRQAKGVPPADQSILLTTPDDFDERALRAIVEKLLEQHDALRLEFPAGTKDSKGTANLRLRPTSPALVDDAVEVMQWSGGALQGLDHYAATIRRSLKADKGRLFKAAFIKVSATQDATPQGRLLLAAHPLVIDGTSWRVLLADLQTLYSQWRAGTPLVLSAGTTPYRRWAAFVSKHAQNRALDSELDYWAGQGSAYDSLVKALRCSEKYESGEGSVILELAPALADQLLTEANRTYRTSVEELLLAGLLLGVHRSSAVRSLGLEFIGHGRGAFDKSMDFSRTVGRFDTLYPLTLAIGAEAAIADVISVVKDAYRAVPAHGLGYGILKYLREAPQLLDLPPAELVFSYEEPVDHVQVPSGDFAAAPEDINGSATRRQVVVRPLSLALRVRQGRLEFELKFDGRLFELPTMRRLLSSIGEGLQEIVTHCVGTKLGRYTTSDFPLALMSAAELQRWQQLVAECSTGEIEDLYPATGMQQGMLFHGALRPDDFASQISMCLEGLQVSRFRQAWQQVIEHNAILRTVFVGLESELVHQLVLPRVGLNWQEHDWVDLPLNEQQQAVQSFLQEDKQRGFVPWQAPLIRASVLKLAESKVHFVWSFHPALLDEPSLPLIWKQVTGAYRSLAKGQVAAPAGNTAFRDQVRWLQSQSRSRARAFWREQLQHVFEPTRLPFAWDSPRRLHPGAIIENSIEFSVEETDRVRQLAKDAGATLDVILQAAWSLLLFRYGGSRKVVFGVVSGRLPASTHIDEIVGYLFNPLPMVVDVALDLSVSKWIHALQEQKSRCNAYGYLPLADIQRLAPHSRPLFDSLLVVERHAIHKTIETRLRRAGLTLSHLQIVSQSTCSVTLKARLGEALSIKTFIRPDAMTPQQQAQLFRHFKRLVLLLADWPSAEVRDIEMLKDEEMRAAMQPLERMHVQYGEELLHQSFEKQVSLDPGRVAAVHEGRQITYGDLNVRANQLAHELMGRGAGPGVLIGLHVERSVHLLVGMLAILKAGGACVPLGPEYPLQQMELILKDAAPAMIVTQRDLLPALQSASQQIVCVDDPSVQLGILSTPDNPEVVGLGTRHVAFVIYGKDHGVQASRPLAGVMIEHRNVMRLFNTTAKEFSFDERDVWVLAHSGDRGFALWEIWGALRHGGKLIIASCDAASDAGRLCLLLQRHNVTVLNQAPSAFYALLQEMIAHKYQHALRYVVLGGEVLQFRRLQSWFESGRYPTTRLVSLYGAAETTMCTSLHRISAEDVDSAGSLIGNALGDMAALVCNDAMQLQPEGAVGELMVTGAGVARGYLNRDDLTAQRFIRIPDVQDAAARFFRTGDLAMRRPSGELVLIGRVERQLVPKDLANGEYGKRYSPAVTQTQETLCALWAIVLGRKAIGIDDDFFESGGHSILALRLHYLIKERFKTKMSLDTIFRTPTIRALAECMESIDARL